MCIKKEAGVFLLGDFSKQTDVEKNFLLLMDISEVMLFKLIDIKFHCNGRFTKLFLCVYLVGQLERLV